MKLRDNLMFIALFGTFGLLGKIVGTLWMAARLGYIEGRHKTGQLFLAGQEQMRQRNETQAKAAFQKAMRAARGEE